MRGRASRHTTRPPDPECSAPGTRLVVEAHNGRAQRGPRVDRVEHGADRFDKARRLKQLGEHLLAYERGKLDMSGAMVSTQEDAVGLGLAREDLGADPLRCELAFE